MKNTTKIEAVLIIISCMYCHIYEGKVPSTQRCFQGIDEFLLLLIRGFLRRLSAHCHRSVCRLPFHSLTIIVMDCAVRYRLACSRSSHISDTQAARKGLRGRHTLDSHLDADTTHHGSYRILRLSIQGGTLVTHDVEDPVRMRSCQQ